MNAYLGGGLEEDQDDDPSKQFLVGKDLFLDPFQRKGSQGRKDHDLW